MAAADPSVDTRKGCVDLAITRASSFRSGFGNCDGGRSTNTTADDSALRECDESRGARYSERLVAQKDASRPTGKPEPLQPEAADHFARQLVSAGVDVGDSP